MVTLQEVADDLYGLPPEEFTSTRNERAKQARAAGDRELSIQITSLPKPTAAAWAVNLLVRRHADEVGQLITLGGLLREAQAALAGDELRALNKQKHQVMAAVVRKAARLTAAEGHRLSDTVAAQVEGTLRAAMSDPEAADAVLSGLLVTGLESSGFEPVDVTGATALTGTLPVADVPRSPARLRAVPDLPAPRTRASAREKAADRELVREQKAERERVREKAAELERVREQETAERERLERDEAVRRRQEAKELAEVAEQEEAAAAAVLEAAQAEVDDLEARTAELDEQARETAARIEELTTLAEELRAESRRTAKDVRRALATRDGAGRAAAAAALRLQAARTRLDEA